MLAHSIPALQRQVQGSLIPMVHTLQRSLVALHRERTQPAPAPPKRDRDEFDSIDEYNSYMRIRRKAL